MWQPTDAVLQGGGMALYTGCSPRPRRCANVLTMQPEPFRVWVVHTGPRWLAHFQ